MRLRIRAVAAFVGMAALGSFGWTSSAKAAGAPSVLVLGGTGKIGAAVVSEFAKNGSQVVAVGRRPWKELPKPIREDFKAYQVSYLPLDLDQVQPADLAKHFSNFQAVVDCAEDYPMTDSAADAAHARSEKMFQAALDAGYTVQSGKVFVRVGSPPAEIPGKKGLSEKVLKIPYFRSKRATAALAQEYYQKQGLNILTAAPTYVVGPGSWGEDREQLLIYFKMISTKGISQGRQRVADWIDLWSRPFGVSTGQFMSGQWWAYAYDIIVDTVTSDAVARGIRLAVMHGKPGETYQLAGRATSLAELLIDGLHAAGLNDLPKPRTATALEMMFARKFESLTAAAWKSIGFEYNPLIMALPEAMGKQRSSKKAMQELGYVPPTDREIQKANMRFVDFLRKTGQLRCPGQLDRVFGS